MFFTKKQKYNELEYCQRAMNILAFIIYEILKMWVLHLITLNRIVTN